MAVTLTQNGVTFNDGTTLHSIYDGGYRQNSRTVMFRASAPSGWSQITDHNNAAFRVVSGTGANSGGNKGFTNAFSSRNVSGNAPVNTSFNVSPHTISGNQLAQHNHPYAGGGGSTNVASPSPFFGGAGRAAPGGPSSGNRGGNNAHPHGGNSGSNGGSVSSNVSFAVQYVDVIICNHS